MAEDKKTAFIDIVFDGPPSHKAAGFVEIENHDRKSVNMGEWLDRDDGQAVLRLPLQRGTWALREAGEAIRNLREHQRQLDDAGVEVAVSRQALDETLAAFKTVLQAVDDRAAVMFDGENIAYAEVLRTAAAVCEDPACKPQDKAAIKAFAQRFAGRAAMSVPATSKKA